MININEVSIVCDCGNVLEDKTKHGISNKFEVFTEYNQFGEVYARQKIKCLHCGIEEYI